MRENEPLFHIYEKKTNEVVKHCLTIEQLEQLIAKRKMDWMNWEVVGCDTDYKITDASY
jgi:hypothetical protein|tara:strand:- start:122 stop:298 length:177 start_codon:yes stop_codon:yes gene_type:complete